MGKLATALSLRPADWLLLAEAWSALAWLDFLVRRQSLVSANNHTPDVAPGPVRGDVESLSKRVKRAVDLAARRHYRPMNCLPKALALRWMLARRGIPSELRIGVQSQMITIKAHAWIERDGKPLGEPADIAKRFAVLQPAASHSGQTVPSLAPSLLRILE